MAKWSDKSQAADATHAVARSTEYRSRANLDDEVEAGDRIQAYAVRTCAQICMQAHRVQSVQLLPCSPTALGRLVSSTFIRCTPSFAICYTADGLELSG